MPENNKDVSIRLIEKTDLDNYFNLIENNRDRLIRYFPVTLKQISDKKACADYIDEKTVQAGKNELFVFVVLKKEKITGVLIVKNIDWRMPKAELAYFIDRENEGKRVMSTAMRHLMRICYGVWEMNKLFIIASVHNIASKRLAEKNGFKLEGILRQEFRIETGAIEDVAYYGKLKSEWDGK